MAKRHDHLFASIANFGALHAAAKRAVLGKRRKPGASAFYANLERELLRLERQLRDGSYRPGRYVVIEVHDPKRRLVSAAPFRDRVVHHALCAVVQPIFEAGFIDHSFANRKGKGTHRALRVYERYRNQHAWVLRCDSVIDRIEVDEGAIRLFGRKDVLEQCVIAGAAGQQGVRTFVPKWRTRQDSNL